MPSLVVLVLHDLEQFEQVLETWRQGGASAVTILDSVGTRELEEQAPRDDLPLMPTIRDLLQSDDAPRKTIFSIVEDEVVEGLIGRTEETVGDLSEPGRGILFVVPVTRAVGIRPH